MEIIVETPRNSREKYEFDPKSKTFHLKKVLPLGMTFPYDFGFIPDTKGEDGGPLDALIISEFQTFPGCRIECRLIGALKAEQTEGKKTIRNDRYFFIPELSVIYKQIKSIKDFPASHNEQLLFFFMAYNEAQNVKFHPIKVVGSDKAVKLMKQ